MWTAQRTDVILLGGPPRAGQDPRDVHPRPALPRLQLPEPGQSQVSIKVT